MRCITRGSRSVCSSDPFEIVVYEDGSVDFEGHDIEYDQAFEAMGGRDSVPLQLYREIERRPVSFVVEFFELPDEAVCSFLLKLLRAMVPIVRKFSNESADLVEGVTYNVLRDGLADRVFAQRQFYNFITAMYSRTSKITNERWGRATGQADTERLNQEAGFVGELLECAEDVLRYIAQLTPSRNETYIHNVAKTVHRIQLNMVKLRIASSGAERIDIAEELAAEACGQMKCLLDEVATHVPELIGERP